ncbi:YDG domain-containing protein [uncultured Selenomonas sp.]|uniref:YDG domain-containing protein n=1 Tax=uncultured Selenomonas sp. TaxID=159275 RepID=UPI0028E3120B|nr:YDG domain-containing protein [uncultured Selenomonas sp.]
MKTASKKQLRRTLLCALFAGALAAPFAAPHAYALPIEGANAAANKTEADISTSGAVMDIVGKTEHNILRWEDFSIEQNEKVRFDGGSQTRDYLNLVTGEGASNIYGTIEGGRNVYLVNPHGILFAKGSEVNTGALYLSTANVDAVASAAGTSWGGNSPLSASTQYSNVLNLGTVQTAKLYIEGKNVTVLNTDAVKDANGTPLTGANVTIRSAETPHIGYDVGHKTTENIDVNGAATPYQVFDYASTNADHHKASASARGWDVANLGGTAHTDYDYMCVHDVYDLQNINAKRDGRYILAGDIDATATTHWNSGEGFAPLGNGDNVFTGRFDGVGHTITALHIRWDKHYIGLFGYAGGARIENLSLKNAHVEGAVHTGGIVGYADSTMIRNVSYAGSVVGNQNVGGIAGDVSGGSIQNAWNAGTVSVRSQFLAGGIVGKAMNNAVIQNVCNTGAITGRMYIGGIVGGTGYNCTIQNAWNTGAVTGSELIGGIVGGMQNDCIVQNVWNTGTVTGNQKVGGIVGEANGGSICHAVSKAGSAGQAVGALSSGADVTTDVKVVAEAQMKQAATYTDWKDEHGNAVVATEGGKGTPWRIYDGHTMPLLTGLMKGTKRLAKIYDGNVFATTDPHITLVHPGKDVGTYDAYSDQFGYDLIGGATIKPKSLTLGFTNGTRFDKTYDGSDTVTRTLTKRTNYSLTGFVGSEGADVELAGAVTGKYSDKNAGRDKEVTFQNLALTGTGAGNYTITRARGVGTITPRELNLALANGARFDKTYDGNANVTQSLAKETNYSLTGFVTGEGNGIALGSSTGTYSDKNAAADKAVTFGGLTLTGTGAGNYVLNKTTLTGTGTIARRALTLGAVAAQTFDKVYDGTRNAGDALKKGENYTLSNFADGEGAGITVTSTGTGSYADKNVGTHAVTYTGLTLTGAGAGNYRLNTATLTGTGKITPRTLTLTADTQNIVQGAPLPSFTGRADGFADGEDERVFGADGITFGTTVTNTDTPGSYGITGRIGSMSDGTLGNYRIRQAAGNATAFTIHAAALPGGLIASLVQGAAPRFDMGFGQEVYVFGLPRPVPTATLGLYRFATARDVNIEGVRLD